VVQEVTAAAEATAVAEEATVVAEATAVAEAATEVVEEAQAVEAEETTILLKTTKPKIKEALENTKAQKKLFDLIKYPKNVFNI